MLRRRPAAEIVLALDRAADVDLVGAALGHLAARARRLRQALVDGGPHRRPAQRASAVWHARRDRRTPDRRAARHRWSAHRCSISWAWRAAVVCGAAVAAWSRRFWTSASALRLTSSSAFLRASSSARRFLCSSSAFLRASSSTARRAGVLGGALARGFGVAVGADQGARAGFLLFLGQGAQHDAAAAGTGAFAGGRTRWAAGCRAPSWRRRRRPASGCGAVGGAAGASGAGAATARRAQARSCRRARLTGFLTSTVTARVRPCENFWRTCVASLLLAARAARAVVERVSGLVGLVSSFCSVISRVVLGPLRRVNRCCSVGSHASAPPRPQFAE